MDFLRTSITGNNTERIPDLFSSIASDTDMLSIQKILEVGLKNRIMISSCVLSLSMFSGGHSLSVVSHN